MKNVNLATTAIVSVLIASGLIATVLIALVSGLLVANNQRDTAIAACERGNVARQALRATATVVQGNLRAVSSEGRADDAVVYARNIQRLQAIKVANPHLDCETIIPTPALIP